MIRAFYRSSAGQVTLDLPATDWRAALHDLHGILWVDFDAALPVEVEPLLRHSATHVLDGRRPVAESADALETLLRA